MRQYRIVSEPQIGRGDSYIIQSKGCGPFSFIWWSYKTVNPHNPFGLCLKRFSSQDEAEKALQDLRRYDNSTSRIVKKCGCHDSP